MFSKKKKQTHLPDGIADITFAPPLIQDSSSRMDTNGGTVDFSKRTTTTGRSRTGSASGAKLWGSAIAGVPMVASSSSPLRDEQPIERSSSSGRLRKSVSDDSLRQRTKPASPLVDPQTALLATASISGIANVGPTAGIPSAGLPSLPLVSPNASSRPRGASASDIQPSSASNSSLSRQPTKRRGTTGSTNESSDTSSISTASQSQPASVVLAVIGAKGVGKSTVIHAGLRNVVRKTVWKRMTNNTGAARGRVASYTAETLFERKPMAVDVYEVDDSLFDVEQNHFEWPKMGTLPKIDAVLLCYDVRNKESLKTIPDLLNSFHQRLTPTLLLGCKGLDSEQSRKEVDSRTASELAGVFGVTAVEVGVGSEKGQKRIRDAVALLVRAIITYRDDRRGSQSRDNNKSVETDPSITSIPFSSSTQPTHSTQLTRPQPQQPLPSPTYRYPPVESTNLPVTSRGPFMTAGSSPLTNEDTDTEGEAEVGQESYVYDEGEEATVPSQTNRNESSSTGFSSSSTALASSNLPAAPSEPPPPSGYTLEELVDKLCHPKTTLYDPRLSFTFFMLYRRFAKPREVLNMLLERFAKAEENAVDIIMCTVTQMRIADLVTFWLQEAYGDFIHPTTLSLVHNFLHLVGTMPYLHHYAVLAAPVLAEPPTEDEDTFWGRFDDDKAQPAAELPDGQTNADNKGTLFSDIFQAFGKSSMPAAVATTTASRSNSHPAIPSIEHPSTEGLGLGVQGLSFTDGPTHSITVVSEDEPPAASRSRGLSDADARSGRPRGLSSVTDHSQGSSSGVMETKSRSGSTTSKPTSTSMSPNVSSAGQMGPPPQKLNGSMHPLFAFSAEEIARELTRMDWAIFSRLQPRQIIRHVWCEKDPETGNPLHREQSVLQDARDQFEWVSSIFSTTLINIPKLKHRVRMLELVMEVGVHLRNMNNYQGLMALRASLSQGYLSRLSQMWEVIKTKPIYKNWQSLVRLLESSRSYAAYRLALRNSEGAIPFFGIHTGDFFSISEGNKDFRPDGKIHWQKFVLLGDVLRTVVRCQTPGYEIPSNPKLNEVLRGVLILEDVTPHYEKSYLYEPRTGTTTQSSSAQMLKKLVEGLTAD